MGFMDKAKDVAEKFKNSDNEQVDKAKDKINEYTGGNDSDNKDDKKDDK
ncbi:SAS049 family protein [Staphylococcus devriesei]|nr:SAS049 family protein [Staphylococcus devriesei]